MRINLARRITAAGFGIGMGSVVQAINGLALASTLSCAAQHLFLRLPCVAPRIARHVAKALGSTALCLQLFLARSTHRRAYDNGHLALRVRDMAGHSLCAERRNVAPHSPLLGRIAIHRGHPVP
jgi:hypothetical protein